jgi:hypothetical protein
MLVLSTAWTALEPGLYSVVAALRRGSLRPPPRRCPPRARALFSRCPRGMETASTSLAPEQVSVTAAVGQVRRREAPALTVLAETDDPDQRPFILPQTRRKRGRRSRNTPAARNVATPAASDAVVTPPRTNEDSVPPSRALSASQTADPGSAGAADSAPYNSVTERDGAAAHLAAQRRPQRLNFTAAAQRAVAKEGFAAVPAAAL